MAEDKTSTGVVIPKWLFGIVTSVGTVVFLALGGWVVNTWDNPAKIESLEARIVVLESDRTEAKLERQASLGKLNTTIALMQSDVNRLAESNAELRPLILEAIAR